MKEPFVMAEEKPFLHLQEWEERFPGLVAGFTIRTGGVSELPYGSFNMGLHVGDDAAHVVTNRKALAEHLQLPFEAWTCADQVHGNQVCRVVASGAGRESLENVIQGTDGLYTEKAEVLLASFYADCVPLFFLDPASGAIGLAHAGWKGTVGRIAEEMVKAFETEYHANRDKLLVAIGPSIGGCCYEVDERIMERVRESAKHWEGSVSPSQNGRYMLDLRKLNTEILLEAGISKGNIATTDWCTSCRTDLFFSHRKEAGASGTTGRMASFIGWKNSHQKGRKS